MSGVIHTGSHPKALWPGVKKWWGISYEEHQPQYPALFDEDTSDRGYEEFVEEYGFGLAVVKPQNGSITYDTESQGPTTRLTHVTYALGYMVTEEEMDDNQYEVLSKRRAGRLAFVMRQTKEQVLANIYNRAFNSSYTYGDAKELCATDHPTPSGNQSNELATAADLSEAAVEDLITQIRQATNARGMKVSLQPQSLHVPPQEEWNANRIMKSVLQSDSAQNNINVLKATNAIPKGIFCNNYFSSASAWFIRTNAPEGMKLFQRKAIVFDQDNDFDTRNAKAAAVERYVAGPAGDWRGVYGTPGV